MDRRRTSSPITDERRAMGRRLEMRRLYHRRRLVDRRRRDYGLVW